MGTMTLTAPTAGTVSAQWLTTMKTRFTRFRLYRQTLKALSDLDDRQLDDLGLTRSTLKRTAYQAAQDAA